MITENSKDLITFIVTADKEVEQDFITITYQATETGNDPNVIQLALAERMKAALDIARPKKIDGQVNVSTGNFQISPTYDKKGQINGYRGAVQLITSGTDTKTVSGLTGSISTMNVADVQHSVSPGLQKSVEEGLGLEAIQLWRAKGDAYARAFGATSTTLVTADVRVASNNGYNRRGGVRMMAASASLEAAGGSYDDEGGKETLTAHVSGTLQLVR